MRLTGILLSVSALAAGFAVAATLLDGGRDARLGAAVALLALAAYAALVARHTGHLTRWSLTAGAVLVALAMAIRAYAGPPAFSGAGLLLGIDSPANPGDALREYWHGTVLRDRIVALVWLAAVIAFVVALRTLPHRRARRRYVVLAALAVLAVPLATSRVVGTLIEPSWPVAGDGSLPLLGGTWEGAVATFAAVGAVVIAAGRTDARLLLPIGALMLLVAALSTWDDLADAWSAWSHWQAIHRGGRFVSVGVMINSQPRLEFRHAFQMATAVVGPGLLVVGALRTAGPPDTGPPDTGPPDTGPTDTGPPDTGPAGPPAP